MLGLMSVSSILTASPAALVVMKVPSDAGRVVSLAVDGSNITLPGVLFSGSAGKTLHGLFDSLSSLDPDVLVALYHFKDLSWLVPQ